jgi:hypothetical protein
VDDAKRALSTQSEVQKKVVVRTVAGSSGLKDGTFVDREPRRHK